MLNPNDYANHYLTIVDEYISAIQNNEIVHGKFKKLAVELFLRKKEKYTYKESEVKKVFRFFSLLNINHKNKVEQFQLIPYQAFAICNLYGLYTDDVTKKHWRVSNSSIVIAKRLVNLQSD